MIDTNLSIGNWPFRKLPGEDLASVTERLKRLDVTQGWTGSLEGLFQRDVAAVNLRLAQACHKTGGLLVPFGTVNPNLPDWEEDLRRCHEDHKFPGIRLHPGFHGYDLNAPAFTSLLGQATERRLIVQLVVTMEDERTHHPVFRVPFVDLGPLVNIVKSVPDVRLVLLNAFRKTSLDDAAKLAAAGQVWFDIAMLEGVDKISALVEKVGPARVLFGSHFPLFYIESAALKLTESMLPAKILDMVKHENARGLLQS